MLEWSDIDWGNAPSWGALGAAIVAACFAGRNVLVDRQDRRLEQAGKVAAWWAVRDSNLDPRFNIRVTEYGAWVRNASEVPVYDVFVEWLYGDSVKASRYLPVLPPQSDPAFLEIPNDDGTHSDAVLEAIDKVDGGYAVRLTFRDARGRGWVRSKDGRLVRQRRAGVSPSRSADQSSVRPGGH